MYNVLMFCITFYCVNVKIFQVYIKFHVCNKFLFISQRKKIFIPKRLIVLLQPSSLDFCHLIERNPTLRRKMISGQQLNRKLVNAQNTLKMLVQ